MDTLQQIKQDFVLPRRHMLAYGQVDNATYALGQYAATQSDYWLGILALCLANPFDIQLYIEQFVEWWNTTIA